MSAEADSPITPLVRQAVLEGRRLEPGDVRALARLHDILALGALADEVRRRHRGTDTTFVRVHAFDLTRRAGWTPPPAAAREVRLSGEPAGLEDLVEAVRQADELSGACVLRGYSLASVWALGGARALQAVAGAGLDEIAWVEVGPAAAEAIVAARDAGLVVRAVGLERPLEERAEWLAAVRALQDTVGGLDVVAPLPRVADVTAPTTGFDDVRAIALARVALDGPVSIQVDWRRDGPKLAQVALTVGADDLDLVSAEDDQSGGPRRAPLEDVRRNIAAAGLTAVERDGRRRRLSE